MPTPRARRADDIDRAAAAITGRDAACRVGNGKIADALFVVAFLFLHKSILIRRSPDCEWTEVVVQTGTVQLFESTGLGHRCVFRLVP